MDGGVGRAAPQFLLRLRARGSLLRYVCRPMTDDVPASPDSSRSPKEDDTSAARRLLDGHAMPTPFAFRLHETQRAFAAVRAPVERRVLTVISGPSAGVVFTLQREIHLLGRGEVADMQVDDADVSRIHARFRRGDDGKYTVEDASSTNGTFLGERRIDRATLSPGDRIQCGPSLVLRYTVTDDIEQELLEQMHASATRDVLTRVYNRAHFLERLSAELAHAARHRVPLSVLVIDVDGLARVNEADGPAAGDILLRAIAGRLHRLIRVEDVLARFGGDEFAVLARSTPLAAASLLAERLRAAVRDIQLPAAEVEAPRILLSIGVSSLSELRSPATTTQLLALAVARLRLAKAAGGDRVCATG